MMKVIPDQKAQTNRIMQSGPVIQFVVGGGWVGVVEHRGLSVRRRPLFQLSEFAISEEMVYSVNGISPHNRSSNMVFSCTLKGSIHW